MMNLPPTTQWYCDVCGGPIKRVEDGWVEWLSRSVGERQWENFGLRIVHHCTASARGHRCQYDHRAELVKGYSLSDMHLSRFTGPDGLVECLELLHMGQAGPFVPQIMVVDFIMRIHVPGYEEARGYLAEAVADGFIDNDRGKDFLRFRTQGELAAIIKEYRK